MYFLNLEAFTCTCANFVNIGLFMCYVCQGTYVLGVWGEFPWHKRHSCPFSMCGLVTCTCIPLPILSPCLSSLSLPLPLTSCVVVQLRKNPPSPLNRGKRISGTKEKFRKSGKPSLYGRIMYTVSIVITAHVLNMFFHV